MALFQRTVLKKHLLELNNTVIDSAYKRFTDYFHNSTIQKNIREAKEEQFQEGFLRELFGHIMGYTLNPNPNFNLTTELKNTTNSKKADGAILIDGKAIAVIELKGTETTDLNKIEVQAFGYKNNQSECTYVITSNFEKLRFYIDNTIDYEEFNLFKLNREQFNLLYLCLSYENIKNNIPKRLKAESVSQEDQITKKLYRDYSEFKRALFNNLVTLNPQYDKLLLFKKTQKLLDRFLFIFFAEDRLLLPTNLIFRINQEWKNLQAMRIPVSLYERYMVYFNDLNHGAKVTLPAFGKKTGEAITAEFEIFAYNGGLFLPDEVLDNVKIDDILLHIYSEKLSHYDFDSDVDVNILGHIFENSLNEIDEIKSEIEGEVVEKTKTKRKKDGVFYTPKYITKYIVDNTVGKICEEKKAEIKLTDEDYINDKKLQTKTKKALLDKLSDYRNWLLDLTICDPACGSGAFLNQALEFLISEHYYIDELQAKLMGDAMILSDVETSILENNIYGVDLNDESVEIAKLSLWLRTAQKGRKLNSLNNNIKCGNSLIDDPAVAGEKSFSWEKEFPEVFAKGGFDVVIGNPPYVPTEYIIDVEKKYLELMYHSAFGRMNLFPIFYEKGIKIMKEKAFLGFITPYTLIKNQYYKEARKYIIENTRIIELIDFKGVVVFQDAAVDSMIVLLEKDKVENYHFKQISNIVQFENKLFSIEEFNIQEIKQNEDLALLVSINDKFIKRISKNTISLKEVLNFSQGIITGGNSKYITFEKLPKTEKVLTGSDFNRYTNGKSNQFIIYDVVNLHRPRKREIFEAKEKILLRQTSSYPICTIDYSQYFTLDTVHNGILINDMYSLKYILVLLNSKLLRFLYESQINEGGKVFAQVKIIYVDPLPIKILDKQNQVPFEEIADYMLKINNEFENFKLKFTNYLFTQYQFDKLTGKLEKWYELQFIDFIKELNKVIKVVKGTTLTKKDEFEWLDLFEENKKKALELKAEIDKTDKEIDRMVYELYRLTEEEIKIVEGV